MIELLNMDCMDYLKKCDDNAFQLAICDPPYGIKRFKKGLREGDRLSGNQTGSSTAWNNNVPTDVYFNELFRVSKNQIIWGANNFNLPPSEYFIFWDKCQTVDNFADGEQAYVSMGLKKPAKLFKYAWGGLSDGILGRNKKIKNINPAQKPIKLYEWLLTNYAKEGDRILDTHGGSMSSAIACHNLNYDMTIIELDDDYFKAGKERLEAHQQQLRFSM